MTETAPERSLPLPSPPPAARSRSWRYSARPDSESALCRLTALLRAGETRVALVGPPASGKTLLLHVLSERLGPGFPSVYLPNPAIGPDQVRPWVETCGGPIPADAGASLEDLAHAHAMRGPGLVLLIDDADDMPDAVAAAFGQTLAHTGDQLRVVVAGADEQRLEEVLDRLGGHAERVPLGAPRARRAPLPPEPEPAPEPPLLVSALAEPSAPAQPAPLPRRPAARARLLAIAGGALLVAAAAVTAARFASTERAAPSPVVAAQAQPAAVGPPVLVHLNARPWARISVDGRALGLTPLGNVPIAPGVRRFRAEMADGSVIEREVAIEGGSRRLTFP